MKEAKNRKKRQRSPKKENPPCEECHPSNLYSKVAGLGEVKGKNPPRNLPSYKIHKPVEAGSP